jgi:hypothetical protein
MAKRIDGVIEAVRYTRDQQISLVRAYVRRGPAFSDRVLLDRDTLLNKVKEGKTFYTGQRKELWAGTFDLGKIVHSAASDGKEFLTTRPDAPGCDQLEETPIF